MSTIRDRYVDRERFPSDEALDSLDAKRKPDRELSWQPGDDSARTEIRRQRLLASRRGRVNESHTNDGRERSDERGKANVGKATRRSASYGTTRAAEAAS